MLRDRKRSHRVRQVTVALGVTTISKLCLDHAFETVSEAFSGFAINVELWRLDPQRVARHTSHPFDVKRRARLRIGPRLDIDDVISPENKNIAAVRFDEVIGKLVDENLVDGVDRAARDDV